MRILWVKANKLLPVSSGGDIRSYNIARQLASRHELTFLSYYDGKPDAAYEQELRDNFLVPYVYAVAKVRALAWPAAWIT